MENELLENLGRLHTTELGVIRIKKNLSLNVENVIEWCKEKISLSNTEITRKGKNWYITIDNCIITVNAESGLKSEGNTEYGTDELCIWY